MLAFKSLLVASALAAAAPCALAERWLVNEGQRGEWAGTWLMRASTGNFRIVLRQGGSELSAEGFYIRSGNAVSIARTRSSDGNDCHYVGTITGNTVTGTSFCASGGPYKWTATIAPD